jgi:hypothetical protein
VNISEISAQKTTEAASSANVQLQKGASKQAEAVAAQLIGGISQTPAPEASAGHNLNKVA